MATKIIPQPIGFGLSDDQLAQIGIITLNWGSCEVFASAALSTVYGNKTPSFKNLFSSLDIFRKIDLITEWVESGDVPTTTRRYILELKWCFGQYKQIRNILSHGVPASIAGVQSFITGKGQIMEAETIDLALQQSRYSLFIAYHLLQTALGNASPPTWPDRPT